MNLLKRFYDGIVHWDGLECHRAAIQLLKNYDHSEWELILIRCHDVVYAKVHKTNVRQM